jgi:hypothetical protein
MDKLASPERAIRSAGRINPDARGIENITTRIAKKEDIITVVKTLLFKSLALLK